MHGLRDLDDLHRTLCTVLVRAPHFIALGLVPHDFHVSPRHYITLYHAIRRGTIFIFRITHEITYLLLSPAHSKAVGITIYRVGKINVTRRD